MSMNMSNRFFLNFKVDYHSINRAIEDNGIIIISNQRLFDFIKLTLLVSLNEYVNTINPTEAISNEIKSLKIDLSYELDKLITESRMDVYEATMNSQQINLIQDIVENRFDINVCDDSSIPVHLIKEFLNINVYNGIRLFDIRLYDAYPYSDIFIIGLIPSGGSNGSLLYRTL